MSIQKDIAELIQANVFSEEIAEKVRTYYKNKETDNSNRLFVVFGVLGAILVGMGLILIIAHNWDDLSRPVKTILAFVPLFIGQLFTGYSLLKKRESIAWRESSSAFLFFTVGASISLVSQIYNIPGNLSGFLLIWMLLCLPLVYLMKSSVVSLLYIVGISYYAGETSYWSYPVEESYVYWMLLLAILPHYYNLYKKNSQSNYMIIHNWIIPLSIVIVLGTVANNMEEFMYVAYFSLFGLLYLIGSSNFFSQQKLINNSYKILGSLGTIILLLTLSFDWFWEDLREKIFSFNEIILSPEFIVSILLSLIALGIAFFQFKGKKLNDVKPITPVFILFIIIFIIGMYYSISLILINLIVFGIGILTIREGANQNHLGILNYGLLVITALIICRFFDTDISFVIRGLLFVFVGLGFFATNYWMLKKRKAND